MENADRSAVKLPEVAAWNVVFLAGPREAWWDGLTDPRFRHVCAFGYDPHNDSWIIVDPRRSHMQVSPVDDAGLGAWLAEARPRITDIRQAEVRNAERRWPWAGFWCVAIVKQLIGSNSGAFTPHGLWRELVREQAPRVFDDAQPETAAGRSRDQSPPASR